MNESEFNLLEAKYPDAEILHVFSESYWVYHVVLQGQGNLYFVTVQRDPDIGSRLKGFRQVRL